MSPRSTPHSSSASNAQSVRVADVLARSLETALVEQCAREYEARVALHRLEPSSDEGTVMPLRIECRGLLSLSARLVVIPVGGGIFDVLCTVEDGRSRRFSYSLGEENAVNLTHAPYLGRKLARFLLDEVKKGLGELLLQSPARPPARSIGLLWEK